MRFKLRSVSVIGLGAIAVLIVLGAAAPPPKPSGEPDAPAAPACASQVRRPESAASDAARAASRPTRLDPLMAL